MVGSRVTSNPLSASAQVTFSLDAAMYGLQSGVATVGLIQTPGSQGATEMLDNDLSGRLPADPCIPPLHAEAHKHHMLSPALQCNAHVPHADRR